MKIYFEKFGDDSTATYLTPMKLYEVVELVADGRVASIEDDEGEEIGVEFIDDYHTRSSWKFWTPKKAEDNNMKIYFEEFGWGFKANYLTPMKPYEVVDRVGDVLVTIKDDVGDDIVVAINGDSRVGSPWKVSPEETRTQSAVGIVASLESERNALANLIDGVNDLLDSLSVPKSETLVERVKLAVNERRAKNNGARIVQRTGPGPVVKVEMVTESGEIVSFYAPVQDDHPEYTPVCPAASSKEGE